jgi:uncharacterized protein YxjI
MYYEIEKHLPGLMDTIDIYDENGEVAYQVDSRVVLTNRTMRLFNQGDELISVIKREVPSFEPKYKIYIEGQLFGELVKEFTFFEPRVRILSEYGPIISKGDLIGLDFQLLDVDGNILASVDDELSEDENTYGVEIDEEADDEFILSLLMVIDVLLNDE